MTSQLERWKRQAKAAEHQLHMINDQLDQLITDAMATGLHLALSDMARLMVVMEKNPDGELGEAIATVMPARDWLYQRYPAGWPVVTQEVKG